MAKKKELTFADQAKKIIARYKNRLGENLEKDDPLAKRALQRELQELAMQQEAAKQSMQMDDMGGEGGGQPIPAPAMMAYGGDITAAQYNKMLLQKKTPEQIEQMNAFITADVNESFRRADNLGARYLPTGRSYDIQDTGVPFTGDIPVSPVSPYNVVNKRVSTRQMSIPDEELDRIKLDKNSRKRIKQYERYQFTYPTPDKAVGGELPRMDGTSYPFSSLPPNFILSPSTPKEATFEPSILYGDSSQRLNILPAKPIDMSSIYMPTVRTAGTMNKVINSPYSSSVRSNNEDNNSTFPWTALAAPLAQVAGNTISALTTGKAETASMPTPPQGPSFIEPNYNTARQLAKERNIDAKRSANRYSGPYAAIAIGKQADVELQKELAAIDELENNEKAKAGNAFNMGIYQGQLDWASKDAQMRVANAGMVNKSRENASQYINMAGQNLAKIPQTIYDMGLQKEMLPWLNDNNAGSITASDGSIVPAFYQYGVYSYKDPQKGLIYMDDAYNIIDENKAKELMRQYKSRIQIKPEDMSKTKEGKK